MYFDLSVETQTAATKAMAIVIIAFPAQFPQATHIESPTPINL